MLAGAKRIVVKVGSALVADAAGGDADRAWLAAFAADAARAMQDGTQLLVVSSGAVALGRRRLGLTRKALTLPEKQAAAAAGQSLLMRAWEEAFEPHDRAVAQLLMTRDDTEVRRRWLNARATTETLLGLSRIMAFVTAEKDSAIRRENKLRLKVLARDLRSLQEHAKFLNEKATFLLDAVLGVINIEQTAVIKTFSVVAVALMPPTLIASIYGMNFAHMPELSWPLGYPLAVVLMIGIDVYLFYRFRKAGWL